MERKAEDENARARTRVRNQAVSSPTTPRSAHTGEKNREKVEHEKSRFDGKVYLLINHFIKPFLTILVKHSGYVGSQGPSGQMGRQEFWRVLSAPRDDPFHVFLGTTPVRRLATHTHHPATGHPLNAIDRRIP